ncbi:hypothetical protein LMG19089_03683 [Ralstonia edaphis]|uniref:DUF4376 domain-containing protein n=1 Tax=Ralstonia edaphi TaxID=3058599 RepID=UPI0028F6BBCA|nr:hypothetical protein [Ralstonia sp. LMG 6871]CAJ0704794.1 hypothetical protein LMG19089_03683 [Ralstonia sp. LMG 6871]
MAIWKDASGQLHDDMDGAALGLPGWPDGLVKLTDSQVAALKKPTLEQAKAEQTDVVSSACQTTILAGFSSSALGSAHTYPAQLVDQQNLSASVLASVMPGLSSGWTTPFWCADSNGNWSYADHTAAQIQRVGQDGKAAILAAIEKKVGLVAQINAATSVSAVQAITW